MKKSVRHLISAAFVLAFMLIVGLIAGLGRNSRAMLSCGELEVKFSDTLEFMTEDDVRECLEQNYGRYIGQRLDSVGLCAIENILEEEDAVRKCEAWTTDDGILHLKIDRCRPVLHFVKGNSEAYADENGNVLVFDKKVTARVPVIEGILSADAEWVRQAKAMTDYMGTHYWADRISKIMADDKGEITLVSAETGEKILFGTPTDIEEKFWRLGKYYSHILPSKDDGYYKTVNVKFKKQIICSRTDI